MNVGYYPGCSLRGTAIDYAASIKGVCSALGIVLEELEDWNCCGATAAHSLDRRTAVNLGGRNIRLAEQRGDVNLVAPCPLCFNRLKRAEAELSGSRREEYDVAIAGDRVAVWDLANFLSQEEILEHTAQSAKSPLEGIRAVCYYGCMASRPPRVTGEEAYENPMAMDRILGRLGAEVMPWSYKTDCCGASHLVARPDVVFELVGRLYRAAHRAGANCIVVSCQMCQANLDLHQAKVMQEMGSDYRLPVIYFTELMGLALSVKAARKWLGAHFVDPTELIVEECGIALP